LNVVRNALTIHFNLRSVNNFFQYTWSNEKAVVLKNYTLNCVTRFCNRPDNSDN
jgi:hypothetical protein